jgi:hypothetical protein
VDAIQHRSRRASDGSSAHDRSGAHLDRRKIGRYGEYYAKMALVRAGHDVYAPEVDDKAIDLILRVPESPPRYYDVQVKTVRPIKSTYLFMRKKHFTIESNRYLALVLLREGEEPSIYMILASAWSEPQPPFSSRDYEGLKSEPEYGLTISRETLRALEPFRFRGRVPAVQSDPAEGPSTLSA